MWTDQDPNQFAYDPEGDPVLGRMSVILYGVAALAAALVTILIVMRSPMHF